MKQCPSCRGEIENTAVKCNHCGEILLGVQSDINLNLKAVSNAMADDSKLPPDGKINFGDATVIRDASITSIDHKEYHGPKVVQVKIGGDTSHVTKFGEKCPICGKLAKDDYFQCRECGRDFICDHHQDSRAYLCEDCELWKSAKRNDTQKAYEEYVERRSPHGHYVQKAKDAIGRLREKEDILWRSCKNINDIEHYLNTYPTGHYKNDAKEEIAKIEEEHLWNLVTKTDTQEAYEKYATRYSAGIHIQEAQAALKEILRKIEEEKQRKIEEQEATWRSCQQSDSISDYQSYIAKYPKGRHAQEAFSGIDRIRRKQEEIEFRKKEEKLWGAFKQKGTIAAFEEYLKTYPSGRYVSDAKEEMAKIKEENLWNSVTRTDTQDAYERYAKKYSSGMHIQEARTAISDICRKTEEEKQRKLEEDRLWQSVKRRNTLEAHQEYASQYPSGLHIQEAQAAISEIHRKVEEKKREQETWLNCQQNDSIPHYLSYIEKHSKGPHVKEAKDAIDRIRATICAQEEYEAIMKELEDEDRIWSACRNRDGINDYEEYISQYRNGRYVHEAETAIARLEEEKRGKIEALSQKIESALKSEDLQIAGNLIDELENLDKQNYVKYLTLIEKERAKRKIVRKKAAMTLPDMVRDLFFVLTILLLLFIVILSIDKFIISQFGLYRYATIGDIIALFYIGLALVFFVLFGLNNLFLVSEWLERRGRKEAEFKKFTEEQIEQHIKKVVNKHQYMHLISILITSFIGFCTIIWILDPLLSAIEVKQVALATTEIKTIEPNLKDAQLYFNQGLVWYENKNYTKAIKAYNTAIKLNSKFSQAYYHRGNAWHRTGNYDQAIEDYNKTIELNPNIAESYVCRGLGWQAKGNYDRAIQDYNKAIELNPKIALAYTYRGHVWSQKTNYDKAIEDYSKAIELNPKDSDAYSARIDVWRKRFGDTSSIR